MSRVLGLLSIVITACAAPAVSNERLAGSGKLPNGEEAEETGGNEEEQTSDPKPGTNETGGDPTAPPFDTKELDAFINAKLKATPGVPGVSIALVKGSKVVAARAYGLADRAKNAPMKTETILEVASISKTFTAVAIMQLAADKKIAIDTDISTYLGRTLRNPRATTTPITTKMLMTHTSSILGNDEALDSLFVDSADSTLPLGDLSRQFLEQGGRYYTAQSFSTSLPGSTWSYCNLCVGIVGHLVERASQKTLAAQTKEKIFTPLAMTSTTWHLADTDKARLVTPYSVNPQTGVAEAMPHFGIPDWPAGSLKMTASDLGRFAADLASGQSKILTKASLDEMLKVHLAAGPRNPDQGLAFMREMVLGKATWGHRGALPGIASLYSFRANEGMGFVILANADVEVAEATLDAIQEKAYELLSK